MPHTVLPNEVALLYLPVMGVSLTPPCMMSVPRVFWFSLVCYTSSSAGSDACCHWFGLLFDPSFLYVIDENQLLSQQKCSWLLSVLDYVKVLLQFNEDG